MTNDPTPTDSKGTPCPEWCNDPKHRLRHDPTPAVDEHRYAQVICAASHEKPVSDPSLVDPCYQHLWEARKVLDQRLIDELDASCYCLAGATVKCAVCRAASTLAALREQIQELREDVERHKEDHGAACLLAWRIYAAAMSESVDTFQGVPGPDVVLAVEARIDNLCNDETRDPMWFKRAEKAEADLDELKQAARPFSTEEGVDSAGIEEIEALRALLDQGQDDKEKP